VRYSNIVTNYRVTFRSSKMPDQHKSRNGTYIDSFGSVWPSSVRKPFIAIHRTYRNCSYLQKLVKKVNRSAHRNASVLRDASATPRASPHQIIYKVPWMVPVSSMLLLFRTNSNELVVSCILFTEMASVIVTMAPNLCPSTLPHSTLDKLSADVGMILLK
jgi:hypothetical protein